MKKIYSDTNTQNCRKQHKLLWCCVVILMSLLSCVLFSACGDKYKDLKINVFSSDGEIVEELNFIIDPSQDSSAERIGIEFAGIDKKDIGQVKVYSEPYELISDSNYVYNGNMCYVDIMPIMQSSGGAKLIISHLASKTTKEIDLTIVKKSNDVQIINSNYIISIPDEGETTHLIDFTKIVRLMPDGMLPGVGTDDVYFNLKNALPSGVETINADNESLEGMYSGFKVASTVEESTDANCVKIYPVTCMNGVAEDRDRYQGKEINIYFRKTLNDNNVELVQADDVDVDLNNLQLIANDDNLKSFKLTFKHGETPLIETNFFDMYKVEAISTDDQKISAYVEANNDIVVVANVHTEDLVKVDVILRPINYVGDLYQVKKSVFAKGELKADNIEVRKNGEIISTADKINIFDYYEEGNSLGALFSFKPISNSGVAVHQDLNKMQIVISPDILSTDNCAEIPEGVYINSKLFSLMIHIYNDLLLFKYDENTKMMISEPFEQDERIYIKYIQGNGVEESADFGFLVQTILGDTDDLNNKLPENWNSLTPTEIKMNFNRLEGVKSMDVVAGQYEITAGAGKGTYTPLGNVNPEIVYLNRLQGLDDGSSSIVYYLQVANNSVLGIDNSKVQKADFEVEIQPNFVTTKPLALYKGVALKDVNVAENGEELGLNKIIYSYVINSAENVISFVFRQDTDIGEYKITFYQEGIQKASVNCIVYEDLSTIEDNYVSIEANKKAFKNTQYLDLYSEADYIVASSQELDIAIDLPQSVLNSQIVKGYEFKFAVGYMENNALTTISETDFAKYFEIAHDDESFNNAQLTFVKGTYISNKPQYVYLTIKVFTKRFENIVEENKISSNEDETTIKFFIYDEITDQDISINHTNLTRYFEDYLGVYYKDQSSANLEIVMDDYLWNYVTTQEIVDWRIDNEKVDFDVSGKTSSINFKAITGLNGFSCIVKAYVQQFENIFELQCVFNVEKPVLTERLIVKSELNAYSNEEQGYFINLKNGESYEVLAQNYSSKDVVTHAETIVQVFDENGSAYTARDYFDVDQANGKITVKKVDADHQFKLVVFAKDALQYIPSSDKSGYNNPSSFLMDFTGSEQGMCQNAYFVVDILLSNGTEGNPYLINSADDFWEIDDTEEFKKAYYKLMTNINLDNTTDTNKKTISGFVGQITTPVSEVDEDKNSISYYVYTIDGITLNNENKHLFSGFAGNIANIKFVVKYDYMLTTSGNLGVFDVNNGILQDVGVVVSGSATLNTNGTTYFGGLVGENAGTINYSKIVGVDGSIQISGTSKIYFGGLVGLNYGQIIGCEQNTDAGEDDVVLNTSSGRENTLSQIEINSTLSNSNSSIGGVVGLNTYVGSGSEINVGTIHNAFVQATINAENTSNVGGVIGTNSQAETQLKFTSLNDYINSVDNMLTTSWKEIAIYNVKSASTIKAKDNVGGIVGADTNGVYVECDYQILSTSTKVAAIQGNINVGGIAGYSKYGKFAYCSVMSYCWNYAGLKTDLSTVITDVADIKASDYVGGIVGFAESSTQTMSILETGTDVADRVVVVYSSVNAYLQATKQENGGQVGNIGGILSAGKTTTSTFKSIIFNAYFVGSLDGKVNYLTQSTGEGTDKKIHYLSLDNNGSSIYNTVYTLNIEIDSNDYVGKLGHVESGMEFSVTNSKIIDGGWDPNRDFWWGNANINGGYLFITTDTDGENRLPIFDLAPESIDVQVQEVKAEGLERVLMLDYYDFSQNASLNDVQLSTLNEKYNKNQVLKDLLKFKISPSGLGTVVLNVKSSNTNVVDITFDGRLLINGIGECELIFSSVLNPNAGTIEDRSIKVIVDYPIGDRFEISTSKTDKSKVLNGQTLGIPKDTSKQLYIITSGVKEYDFNKDNNPETYAYKTKDNVHLKIELSHSEVINISQYVSISGQTGSQPENSTTYTLKLDNKTPFIVSVSKMLEWGEFGVKITPFTIVEDVEIEYSREVNFLLSTKEGASNITFSYDEAIVYPNDTVYLTANIVTDEEFTDDNIYKFIKVISNSRYSYVKNNNIYLIYKVTEGIRETDSIGSFEILIDDSTFENNVQTVRFRIEFDDITLSEEASLQINAVVDIDKQVETMDQVLYTIIPQRINKIEIKNYYKDDEEWILDNLLKSSDSGKIIVDIAPNNGYYSYLEISDITGDEEILFIQVDENGNALSLSYDPSSDKKGIKLYHYAGQEKSRIYIITQIDKNYSSKMHTIEIRAYSNNGALLRSQTKEIDVKMPPEITVDYILPNGYSLGGTMKSSENNGVLDGLYLANGVDANFKIETKNSNSDLEYVITGLKADGSEDTELAGKYEFVNVVGNHYALQRKDDSLPPYSGDINKKLRISFKTYAYLENGDFEVAEGYVEFTITQFVVHSISVNNSIDNSDTKEIYGYIGKPEELNFYFDKDDISYYDIDSEGEPFWDTVYEYSEGIEKEYTNGSALKDIYSILKELNAFADDYSINQINEYLVLNNGKILDSNNPQHKYDNNVDVSKINLEYNALTVEDDYDKKIEKQGEQEVKVDDPKYLAVEFRLNYLYVLDQGYWNWTIDKFMPTKSADESYVVVKNYKLNFKNATAWYEPTVINDEEDFLEMSSGGRYILAKDLVLKDYVPIDANLIEFDGNGRTITIQSFGLFNDVDIQAGLFKQVYENMIVKNVLVKYQSIEDNGNMTFGKLYDPKNPFSDLCNNPSVNYTSLNFGGIAAINNGIITNCCVEGLISVNASTIEQKKFASGDAYAINFFVGGMVAENGSTGYITNSTSELSVFAQANIGGFVHTNNGKIVSCGVEKSTTIYSYNTSLEKTIVVDIAGFAVENTNHISMSYVNLAGMSFGYEYQDKDGHFVSSVTVDNGGTMSAKDISAGFVYTNSGDIYDSYVNIAKTGINNNTFSGFVYSNSGSITRAYTYINDGTKVDNNDTMFAPAGTKDLSQCIEFVVLKSGYTSGVEQGLTTLEIGKRLNKVYYEEQGFAFGDNESAVWKIDAGEMPKLVSTQEKVKFSSPGEMNGLLPITEHVEIDKDTGEETTTYELNFAYYGTKDNPYIISDLETWNRFFENNTTSYYRIVKDLDFASLGDNPATSKMTFKGNIQGNNMKLENVMLYSTSTLNALGLFRDMSSANNNRVKNAVRNLTLTTTSVWASRTSAVGLLAGLVEDFNLYNITIDAQGVIMVGGNAVGGLAGVVRGDFDIDQISSNIGANSTRASTQYNYSIYMSRNNKVDASSNLSSVYYAGSVVGILDGYTVSNYNINNSRDLNDKYFMVRNVTVNGNISIIGDTVGGAFGLVGERVRLNNINVNISGMLAGVQYSAGVAGENRGVIDNNNLTVVIADNVFDQSQNVSAGIVGFNLGGLIRNIKVQVKIYKTGYGKIVGGVVGRNIYGTVNNVVVDGELNAYFTGGIVGVSYTNSMLINATTGAGTISAECKTNNTLLIPKNQVEYSDSGKEIKNYGNVALTKQTMQYLLQASKDFYSYKNNKDGNNTLATTTVKYEVLGLIVGLAHESSVADKITLFDTESETFGAYVNRYAISVTENEIVFNVAYRDEYKTLLSTAEMEKIFGKVKFVTETTDVLLKDDAIDANDVVCQLIDYNLLTISEGTEYVMYLIGSNVSTFDSWYNSYSEEYLVIKMASSTEQS